MNVVGEGDGGRLGLAEGAELITSMVIIKSLICPAAAGYLEKQQTMRVVVEVSLDEKLSEQKKNKI